MDYWGWTIAIEPPAVAIGRNINKNILTCCIKF